MGRPENYGTKSLGLTTECDKEAWLLAGDDARAAAGMRVTLSTFVITASLGAIAAQAALATFILDKRTHLAWFYVLAGFGLFFLVLSIAAGAKGVTEIYKCGYSAVWDPKRGGGKLAAQAIFAVLGLLCVAGSTFLGDTKPQASNEATRIEHLEQVVTIQRAKFQELRFDIDRLRAAVKELRTEIDKARVQIALLRRASAIDRER